MMELNITWRHLEQTLNDFADEVISLARQNLDSNGTNASHQLYDTMQKIVEIGEDYYKVSISLEDYWKYVEDGRGPGKYPPRDKIREWIEIKPVEIQPGMNGKTPSVEQVAFLISRKIAEEGTEPQPFLQPAVDEALARFQIRIDEAITQDVYDYIQEIVEAGLNKAFGRK